jgi:hypothetical protein
VGKALLHWVSQGSIEERSPGEQAGGAAALGAREVIGLAEQAGQQRCRRCDCVIRRRAYEKGGVTYCCEACAERFECECGCIIFDSG